MDLRKIVIAAAATMGLIEVVATFVEAPYAIVLAALLLLGAAWAWLRPTSIWPVVAVAVLFLLEILYLSDYDPSQTGDLVMIIATVIVSGIGLLAAVVWLIQRRRAAPPA
jgi:hypothetical protein